MTEDLESIYDAVIEALMRHDTQGASTLLDNLRTPEQEELFEQATQEQVAREDLREMIVRRMVYRTNP